MTGLGRDDIIQVAYGYGLFTGGLGGHYGAEHLGATVVPMSTGNTQKLVTMMVDFGVTGILCTPSYLMHIAETIHEQGLRDKIKLKASLNGAEPWTENMRKQIESMLGINCHDIYGLSEIMGPGVAQTAVTIKDSMYLKTTSCPRLSIRIRSPRWVRM